ncbi:sugar ABC transporter [Humibacillus sp. DSM 29435]|uniref:ABC transporter ATP-binding protein n=1 Tax=Humibacillus sp. DSM 29435 TaxID=1869167 RepID=UPI000872284A|nr:ABC transporter ATP-binding protein [Humibacillus sp. DSM 29435]OFE18961.1 sugar ABC transporter [Humibacillus sp. DSM 29435]
MLEVRGLRKCYTTGRHPTAALDRVDLTVEKGSFATVLGPSGSGKTTLLRCIAGFERADAGTIRLAGRDLDSPSISSVRPYDRDIGVVPQEGALFPHLSVARNVAFGIADRPRARRRERVEQLLELVGLQGLGDRRPHQLSGGQQQRVALARALAPEPRLILLDEPFSALDAQLRVELREEVRGLLRSLGTTALLVTHDQAEAMTLADHLVVMRGGRVVAAGDPRQVYDEPVDAEMGRFLGEAVVVRGTLAGSGDTVTVDCVLGRLAVAAETGADRLPGRTDCDVLVRPEQLRVQRLDGPVEAPPWSPGRTGSASAPAATSTAGATASVVAQSFYGHDALVRVRLDDGTQLAVRVPGSVRFGVGDRVRVQVDTPVWTYAGSASTAT